MFRIASLSLLVLAAACTKSPANQEAATKPAGDRPTKVAVPGSEGAAAVKGTTESAGTVPASGGNDSRFRLTPDEGKLSVEAPSVAQVGSETTVKVIVTAGSAYKVNTEFPTKLTLEQPSGVTLAKAELKAGGHDKGKGDADVFDEKQLAFAVKLTPAQSGSYTINGSFKFAVCDKGGSTCLAKKEPIAIQVAAK